MVQPASILLHALKRTLTDEELALQSDRELLDRFIAQNNQAAFATLLRRHGALVHSICRRFLQDRYLAEDAFQAVFIILAKRAGAIRKREALGSWLFGVARRVACQARRRRDRDRQRFAEAAEVRRHATHHDLCWQEMLALLDQEVGKLPHCYQAPLLACYLEGRTQDEAARELGWSVGTLRRRLEKGREILKARLIRQGIGWSVGPAVLGLWGSATEAVDVELRQLALQAIVASINGATINQGVAVMVQAGLRGSAGALGMKLVAGLLVCCSLAGLGAIWSWANAAQPEAFAEKGAAEIAAVQAEPLPPTQGKKHDPSLPDGAIARLGTLRFNHGDGLSALHYTPDGKSIVSYGGGIIRIWNADTGDEVKQFPAASRGWDEHTVLLPDGKTLLSLTQAADKLQYWDLSQGKQTRSIDLKVRRGIISVEIGNALSPDGQLAAIHTQQGVEVHETADGRLRFRTNKRGDMVRAVIFSGDSKRLIQADKGGVIEVWDAVTGMPLKIFDQTPPAQVLAVSRDGRWLATLEHHTYAIDKILETDFVHVWDLEQGKEVRKLAAKGWLMNLHFTADSKGIIASGSLEKGYSRRAWDIASGAELPHPPSGLGRALAFHPDGKRYVTGGGTRFDQWNLVTGKQVSSEITRYARANAVRFDAAGERVITVGYDAISVWEATTGKLLRSFDVPLFQYYDPRPILSADGRFALTYQHASKPYGIDMLLWDVANGSKTAIPLGDPPTRYVNAQHHISPWFSPDGTQLIVRQPGADIQSAIRIWDLSIGKETKQIPELNSGLLRGTILLADGKTLVVPGDQAVGIDITTGKEVFAWDAPIRVASKKRMAVKGPAGGPPMELPEGPAWQTFAISADGKTAAYILSADDGSERVPGRIIVCDGRTGMLLHRLDDAGQRGRSFDKLLFSPDGRTLANTHQIVTHLWDVASGTKIRTLAGHRGDVESLAFSKNGHRLATASDDSTVLIWDLGGMQR